MTDQDIIEIISEGIVDGTDMDCTVTDQARAVLKALRDAGVAVGKVKSLDWEGDGHWFSGDNEGWLEEANTPFGWGYAVEFGNNAESPWIVSSTFGETIRGFDSPGDAKAAAQADYEARILAALEPPK